MAYIFPSIWNRESRNELNKMSSKLETMPDFAEPTEYDPPYLRNAGKVYPFANKGTTDNVYYKNAILDMKVQRAEDNAIYRLEHISKDNPNWGNTLTFFQFQRSLNDGADWKTITDRTNSTIPNNQNGVKTHIISHSGINERFTITIDWNALNHSNQKSYNIGAVQYIIDPNLYFFSRSSNSNVVDLEDNIVVKRNGRQLQIKQPYDVDNNMIVEYNAVGINDYHEFKAFYLQPKSSSYADFTGTEIMRNGTDWISPYGMRVVNNPVSNNAGSITVGGAHGTTGGSGFPTGRFSRLFDFKLDGNAVGNGTHVGKELNITAEHYVSASNAINKDTGAKRDTAIERRFYTIKPRSHSVTVSVEALEDLMLTHYAGFMMPQMSQVFDTFYLHDVADDLGLLPAGGLENGIYHTVDKDYSKIDRAVLVNDELLLVMLTDRTFGIGTGEFAPESTADRPQSPILYTGGQFGKIGAHNLGGSSNDYLLKAGETISYRGGYYFVENQSTTTDVYEYEIDGVTQVDDLR